MLRVRSSTYPEDDEIARGLSGPPYESHFTRLRIGGMSIQSLPFLKLRILSEGEEK
jgi:hypothetical protein